MLITNVDIPPRTGDLIIPSGGILMWSGIVSDIPEGWVLCNGSNGTPDLRGRFVVGAGGSYAPKSVGGSENVAINAAQMSSHIHSLSGLTVSSNGSHYHNYNSYVDASSNYMSWDTSGSTTYYMFDHNYLGDYYQQYWSDNVNASHSHSFGGTLLGNPGSGTAHENRPPYFALCYIMKL